MDRNDANEAAGVVDRMMQNLVATISVQGRAGSDARTIIGYVRVNAFSLLIADALGQPLADCFENARLAGATLPQMAGVRRQIALEAPKTLGAVLVRDTGINMCMAEEAKLIAAMIFVSRQDVDLLKAGLAQPFADAEEIAADAMDSVTYKALVALHAALNNHLVRTAMPLPRMLNFVFHEPLPSLILAYRLYGDASRADEIRNANKIVHPAFCPPTGQALSA